MQLGCMTLSSSIQSCRNVAQYTAELAVKKKVREQSGSLPFFKAGRIYKHRIFHTQCKSMGSPDLLGFAVPFYLVQMIGRLPRPDISAAPPRAAGPPPAWGQRAGAAGRPGAGCRARWVAGGLWAPGVL